MRRRRSVAVVQLLFSATIIISFSLLSILATSEEQPQFTINNSNNGKVIDLDESNFDSAISSFDYVFVDFHAPWCGHCKRLSPELDAAAASLAELETPVVIAKVDADKYRRLGDKYEIDGFPTLKLFMHGVPVDYNGPRKADLLVRFLKKFVAPDVSILDSDTAISNFIESAGTHFPIYIGFGMNESLISKFAIKYKRKAWFAVANEFSDSIMESYDFDKVPALVSLYPTYDERNIFYGPFDDQFLEEFIKQNLFPLCLPITSDSLKMLRDDDRKIVLTFVEDETDAKTKQLVKLLKAAASANREYLFAYAGLQQFQDFVEPFDISKNTKLPKMVVWDGDEEYFDVIGSESIGEDDQGSDITHFLERYKEGRTVAKKISGPTFMQFLNSLVGYRLILMIVFVVAVMMMIITLGKHDEDDARVRPLRSDSSEVQSSGDKED